VRGNAKAHRAQVRVSMVGGELPWLFLHHHLNGNCDQVSGRKLIKCLLVLGIDLVVDTTDDERGVWVNFIPIHGSSSLGFVDGPKLLNSGWLRKPARHHVGCVHHTDWYDDERETCSPTPDTRRPGQLTLSGLCRWRLFALG